MLPFGISLFHLSLSSLSFFSIFLLPGGEARSFLLILVCPSSVKQAGVERSEKSQERLQVNGGELEEAHKGGNVTFKMYCNSSLLLSLE